MQWVGRKESLHGFDHLSCPFGSTTYSKKHPKTETSPSMQQFGDWWKIFLSSSVIWTIRIGSETHLEIDND